MRYVVLDTRGDWEVTEVAGHEGTILWRFHSEESARALAMQRLSYGDRGVIVVDTVTGAAVYPPADEGNGGRPVGKSGTRRKVDRVADEGSEPDRSIRRKRSR